MEQNREYRFSLIVGFTGREACLDRLFASLTKQCFKDFEVIVVDQTPTSQSQNLIVKYNNRFTVNLIEHKELCGISEARNIGLEHARGKWCAFPDDDCWYSDNFLTAVNTLLENKNTCAGISVLVTDANGICSAGGYMTKKACLVKRSNIWRTVVSPSLILRKKEVLKVGKFDSNLGTGASTKWQSGEETDLILRILKSNPNLYYIPELTVFHPLMEEYNLHIIKKGWRYGCGFGAVLNKHEFSWIHALYFASLQFLQSGRNIFHPSKMLFHFLMGCGRLYGKYNYNKNIN